MSASRRENDEVALQYLNTKLRGPAAMELAHKLRVVLDSRLPPRLNELSDRPEGSLADPLRPDQELVGTIDTADGPLDLTLERVARGGSPVWLFSRKTLEAIPDVYDEVNLVSIDRYLPTFLSKPRVAGVRLFGWLMLGLVIPLFYGLTGLASLLLRPLFVLWHRRYGAQEEAPPDRLPGYVRLLFLAGAIRWLLTTLKLPLLERQFWFGIATFLTIAACVWILLRVNAHLERYVHQRVQRANLGEVASLLRLARRFLDGLVLFGGVLLSLHYLRIDASAALAGLGIGGIAVALAAQKTLENVIGGLSLIFDKAMRVGDSVKLAETSGTVEYIGLRSTRIRTLDRTVLTVPNGQIANVGIETLSARDKFWFHHFVGLRCETTPDQMRAVIERVRGLLAGHSRVDGESIRVQFFRLGAFSLDIEVSAYIFAFDWERFLEVQQELLIRIMEIVEQAGTAIAIPSQTLHLADAQKPASVPADREFAESEKNPPVPRGGSRPP